MDNTVGVYYYYYYYLNVLFIPCKEQFPDTLTSHVSRFLSFKNVSNSSVSDLCTEGQVTGTEGEVCTLRLLSQAITFRSQWRMATSNLNLCMIWEKLSSEMSKSLHPGETRLSGYRRLYRTGPLLYATPGKLLLRETWRMASLRSKPIQRTDTYNWVVTKLIHSSGFRKDGLSNYIKNISKVSKQDF